MGAMFTIAGKELRSYFVSWMAYAVVAGYLLLSGYFFYAILIYTLDDVQTEPMFGNMLITLLFVVPMLTMRLLSEEKSTGTVELLLTSPVSDFQVVFGKFLAGMGMLLTMLVCTWPFPAILFKFGNPDPGPLFAGYLGLLLAGAAFVAVGLMTSAWTESQVVAGFSAFGILLLLWVIEWMSDKASGMLSQVLKYLSVISHFQDFPSGIIDTKAVVYYLSIVVLCLFLAVRSLESRKWK